MEMTEEEYKKAMVRIWELMDSLPGTPEERELDILSQKAVEYEEVHFPMN